MFLVKLTVVLLEALVLATLTLRSELPGDVKVLHVLAASIVLHIAVIMDPVYWKLELDTDVLLQVLKVLLPVEALNIVKTVVEQEEHVLRIMTVSMFAPMVKHVMEPCALESVPALVLQDLPVKREAMDPIAVLQEKDLQDLQKREA